MKIKCEFCDTIEFENAYEYAEHLEYHIYELEDRIEKAEQDEKERIKASLSIKSDTDFPPINPDGKRHYKKRLRKYQKLPEEIGMIIQENASLSPKEIQAVILQRTNINVAIGTIYNWRHNHVYGKQNKAKINASEMSLEEKKNLIFGKKSDMRKLPQSVVQIMEVYDKDSPQELSQRIKSSLGIDVAPKSISDWRYNRTKRK